MPKTTFRLTKKKHVIPTTINGEEKTVTIRTWRKKNGQYATIGYPGGEVGDLAKGLERTQSRLEVAKYLLALAYDHVTEEIPDLDNAVVEFFEKEAEIEG